MKCVTFIMSNFISCPMYMYMEFVKPHICYKLVNIFLEKKHTKTLVSRMLSLLDKHHKQEEPQQIYSAQVQHLGRSFLVKQSLLEGDTRYSLSHFTYSYKLHEFKVTRPCFYIETNVCTITLFHTKCTYVYTIL